MEDIVIKVRHIKKGFYILLTIALLTIIVIQYYYPNCSRCIEKTEESKIIPMTEEENKSKTIEETEDSEAESVDNTTEEDTNAAEEDEDEEEEEETTSLSGEVNFKIDDIEYEIKGEDWATVTSIEYTIDNQKADFAPTILVYLYDSNDDEVLKDYVEETISLAEIKAGNKITKTTSVHISFNEIDKEKTVKMVLKNEYDKELETATKKFTAED